MIGRVKLTKAFVQPNFKELNDGALRAKHPNNIRFIALTDFGPDLSNVLTAFPSRDIQNGLVQTLCPRKQLYVAESEKFAHVTYFLNGGYAHHFCDENWVKIDSPEAKSYAQKPEMSAGRLADYVIGALSAQQYDFIALNFANMDMVGHTGDFAAAQMR